MIVELIFLAVVIISILFFLRGGTITFNHEISTTLTNKNLWQQLLQSMEDSSKSEMWPNPLENVTSEGLSKNSIMTVTYHTPVRDTTLYYAITAVEEGVSFTYQPSENHPFNGAITVEVDPTMDGTTLKWHGTFYAPRISIAAAYFRFYYEKKFFTALENNIRALEP